MESRILELQELIAANEIKLKRFTWLFGSQRELWVKLARAPLFEKFFLLSCDWIYLVVTQEFNRM